MEEKLRVGGHIDGRQRRTPMAEDIKEMLRQNRMILEMNREILTMISRPFHTVETSGVLRNVRRQGLEETKRDCTGEL